VARPGRFSRWRRFARGQRYAGRRGCAGDSRQNHRPGWHRTGIECSSQFAV